MTSESAPVRAAKLEAMRLRDLADALELRVEGEDPDAFGDLHVIALFRTAGRLDHLLAALAAVEDVQRAVIPLFPDRSSERTPS